MVMRLYEDMIAGRISEQNFNTMLEKTQTEQTELKTKVSEAVSYTHLDVYKRQASQPCNSGFSLSFFPLADRRSHFL